MLPLSTDPTFHYELVRIIGTSRSYGADISEVLGAAEKIEPGNFESWYEQFNRLAQHIHSNLPDSRHSVSLRNALFRAASYYRAADFFLHGNPADPRIQEIWDKQTTCFDEAISLLDIPGERFEISAAEFRIPGILYRAAKDDVPRPTVLLCNGYDGSQEELLHVFGFGMLERGYNVITFEGPGQPSVVRNQGIGFITEWEKVVTPLVDYCQTLPAVDPSGLVLLGYSFGGFLVTRAAAFEHRLAAVVCVDGLYDIYNAFSAIAAVVPPMKQALDNGDAALMDQIVRKAMQGNTKLRWSIDQGTWAFGTSSPYAFLQMTKPMTMEKIAAEITAPVLVCEAEEDGFFKGQPIQLVNALGPKATYRKLGTADAAQEHCHVGANDFTTSVVMDWVEETVLAPRPALRTIAGY